MMKKSLMRSFMPKVALTVSMLLVAAAAAFGQLTLSATTSAATANSVWTFTAVWTAATTSSGETWPSPQQQPLDSSGSADSSGQLQYVPSPGVIVLASSDLFDQTGMPVVHPNPGGDTALSNPVVGEGIPMYYISGVPSSGATYRVTVSAGLNMSFWKQQPNALIDSTGSLYTGTGTSQYAFLTGSPQNRFPAYEAFWLPQPDGAGNRLYNNLIYDPDGHPMWYAAGLHAAPANGGPLARTVYAVAYGTPGSTAVADSASVTVTVYDSTYTGATATVHPIDHAGTGWWYYDNYGGGYGSGYLTCYPGTSYPNMPDPTIPLTVEPALDPSTTAPNDGATSQEFDFQIRFNTSYGLQPQPSWFESTRSFASASGNSR